MATRDKKFARDIQIRNIQEKPHTLTEGLSLGLKNLEMGIEQGANAFVEDPKHGLKHNGVKGFLKGVTTGVVKYEISANFL